MTSLPSMRDDLLPTGSAHPHVLNDPAQRLLVQRGYLDVFAVFGAPLAGRRQFLFRLEAGALACGISPATAADGRLLTLLGVGGADSELVPLRLGEPVRETAAAAWLAAMEDAADLRRQLGGLALGDANRRALDAVCARVLMREASQSASDWRERRRNFGDATTTAALAGLAGVAGTSAGGTSRAAGAVAAGDPLKAALVMVLEALRVAPQLEAFDMAAELAAEDDRLAMVLRRHQLIRRTVLLRPGWTAQPGAPLLGFLGSERRPVALLYRRGRWWLHDAGVARPIARDGLEASGVDGLASDAVQVYPTLPAHSLRFRDLFSFGFATIGADRPRLIGLMLAAAILAMLVPYGSRFLVSDAIPYGDMAMGGMIIGGLLAAALAKTVFEAGKSLTMLRSELGFESRLQPALILRLLRLPPAFFRLYAVGDLTDRVLGIQRAREVITASFTSAAASSVFSVISLVPIMTVDVRLGFTVLGLAIVLGVVNAAISYRGLVHERLRMAQKGKLDSFVVQMLMGLGKLRASASEQMGFARWAALFSSNMRHSVAAGRWANLQATADALLPQLATLTLYAVILYLMKSDMTKAATASAGGVPFSLADFVSVTTAFAQVLGAISSLAGALTQSLVAIPLIERAKPIIFSETDAPPANSRPVTLQGGVDIRNVSFRYTEKSPRALDDFNLRIEKGEFIAVVGASGSGKSTLLRLLLGFDRPEQGDIFFDGHSLNRLDLAQVRRQVGVVLQHGRIMSGSINDNIVGESGLGMEDALEAARLVGLDKDIEQMPMGMHTVLLDGGGTLSGGQRQRILLARALITRPSILLLDEATSALDNRTQSIVTQTLQALPVTRLVIAHRLSTIESVDRIVMLERGRVVETGSFSELMAMDGHFATHARRQLI
ncbi:ATP-binding cassette domain-containing protein [Rhizobium sp. RU36D]|uniref:ATP-binding cassette domain-containing protein n=1 Tax=Rhizobium sp. RU36D TaxID=1907415 RepID=UPI0009D8FEBA|nr:ATP-binding cassette domain-containing protein [Rhizobium sp. RU36D]SMD17751.1 NHLM bacteriocin system ABC transporter, ATP-binding protein [Rhizobium sp. RU36D]